MTSMVLLVLYVLLMSSSVCSFEFWYFGGAQTVTPKGGEGTYEVELRNKQATFYCNSNPYKCAKGKCGEAIQSASTRITSDSYVLRWCQKETKTSVILTTNLPFEIRYPTISNEYRTGYWIRGYTYRVTRNCPRTFNLNMFDPDGDRVRCKVAKNARNYECGYCAEQPGISLDKKTCSVTYTYGGEVGHIPVELVIQDTPSEDILLAYSDGSYTLKQRFPRGKSQSATENTQLPPEYSNLPEEVQDALRVDANMKFLNDMNIDPQNYRSSIFPLSKLPLQFTVLVDSYSAPSCSEGDYFPVFSSQTPAHGDHVQAFVNNLLQISIEATAQHTRIYKLIVTGPIGISTRIITRGEFIIRWTPTENDLNDHFPFCFVAEALDKDKQVYHSELRCVTVDVGHYDTVVTCDETTMTVEVLKTGILSDYEDRLRLLSESTASECSVKTLSNSTHLVVVTPLDSCGTYVEEDEDNILYKNSIISAEPDAAITRSGDIEIPFCCAFPKEYLLTLGFKHKNTGGFDERGFGSFSFRFEFFLTQQFKQRIDTSSNQLEVDRDQMIFMQIQTTTHIPDVELFVESCKATPEDNPHSTISYSIIENGCVKDSTVQLYPSANDQFRFGMEAFEFIGANDEVYITCTVLLCEFGIPNTRCSQGCIEPGSGRRRREAANQTSLHFISLSLGPLHLSRS